MVAAVGGSSGPSSPDTPGAVAELYLGNILYALERCAMTLEAESQPEHAAFYRGIARKLAEAKGRQADG